MKSCSWSLNIKWTFCRHCVFSEFDEYGAKQLRNSKAQNVLFSHSRKNPGWITKMLGANLGLSCTCLPEKLCDMDTAAVSCCKKIGAHPEKCGGGGRYLPCNPWTSCEATAAEQESQRPASLPSLIKSSHWQLRIFRLKCFWIKALAIWTKKKIFGEL